MESIEAIHRAARVSCWATLVILASACAASYPTVQTIRDATVPAGDVPPPLEDPVRENMSLRFVWEFNSHLEDAQYLDSVIDSLTHDGFSLQQRTSSSIGMNRLNGGDSYRLNIQLVTESATHVRATLVVSPG